MRPLVADGGELTVLRSLAAYSYGQWSVEWPDSVPEEQRPELPDEREFGYVAKLDKEPGRMGRRFVRADVSITAAEYTPEGKVIPYSGFSDVEQVIDEAASRTTGDVFFEREIERAGLNANIPYVDFDVDDLVPVTLWGKSTIVPVTSIQEVTEAGEAVGWRVRVGGDLIADDVARERANRDIEAAIAQERRERLRDSGEVRTAARVAQSTANTAVEDARRLTESLSGPDATTATVFEQLEQLTDDLEGQGLPALEGLLPNYIQLNTRLWQQQDEINALQAEINTTSAEDRAQIRQLVGELQRAQSRELLRPVLAGDERWSVQGGTITALGSWTGTVLTFGSDSTTRIDRDNGATIEITDSYPVFNTLPVPRSDGSRVYSNVSAAVYLASEGEQRTRSLEAGILDVARGSLTRLEAYDFVAETDIEDFYVSFVAWLDAADRGTRYRLEVQVNGVVLYGLNWTKIGPLGPLGNGHRQMALSKSRITLKKGDVVSFHYLSEGEEASQRRLRSSEVFLSWIELQEGI